MNNRKLLLIGGGGHCKSVIDVLEEQNVYHAIGIVDMPNRRDTLLLNYPVVGCDDDLEKLFMMGYKEAFITIGSLGNCEKRKRIFQRLIEIGFEIPNVISETATISRHISIGQGNFIAKNAVVNVSVEIGSNSILNSGVIVEHDCKIGDFVHVAPGVTVSGDVEIGHDTHIGTNATIIQGIIVGANTIIGAGSVVITNVSDNVIAYGVPCKERKKR
jgi:sugar O-acyltransferase (sialic acid O-acetyltransferase NeuD family)